MRSALSFSFSAARSRRSSASPRCQRSNRASPISSIERPYIFPIAQRRFRHDRTDPLSRGAAMLHPAHHLFADIVALPRKRHREAGRTAPRAGTRRRRRSPCRLPARRAPIGARGNRRAGTDSPFEAASGSFMASASAMSDAERKQTRVQHVGPVSEVGFRPHGEDDEPAAGVADLSFARSLELSRLTRSRRLCRVRTEQKASSAFTTRKSNRILPCGVSSPAWMAGWVRADPCRW